MAQPSTEQVVEPQAGETNPATGKTYTQDELNAERERVRKEERDKLYAQQEETRKRLEQEAAARQAFETEVKDLKSWKEQQEAQVAEEARKAAEAAKTAEESELSAKQLLERREAELRAQLDETNKTWEQKFAEIQAQRERDQAIQAKEQEMSALRNYTQDQIRANQDALAPQLLQYIDGNTKEEVDASVQKALETSRQIAEDAQRAFAAAQHNRGVGVGGAGPTGPTDMVEAGQQQYTPEQIANMPMNEYAKFRARLGLGGSGQNRGMFG